MAPASKECEVCEAKTQALANLQGAYSNSQHQIKEMAAQYEAVRALLKDVHDANLELLIQVRSLQAQTDQMRNELLNANKE